MKTTPVNRLPVTTMAPDSTSSDNRSDLPDAEEVRAALSSWLGEFDAEAQRELDLLKLLLQTATGSVIAIAHYKTHVDREAGVQYLKDNVDLPVREFAFAPDRRNPIPTLREIDVDRACLHLYDVENALPDVAGVLNLQRESFGEVPHAVVLWVNDYGLREISRRAPDFFAWSSGVYEIHTDAPNVSRIVNFLALTEPLRYTSQGDLGRKESFYKDVIQKHEALDDANPAFLARMYERLAKVQLNTRRFEDADNSVKSGLEWVESERSKQAASLHCLQAKLAFKRGDLDQAEEIYRSVKDTYEHLEQRGDAAKVKSALASIAQEKGDVKQARRHYTEALQAFEDLGLPSETGTACLLLGVFEMKHADNDDEAERLIARSIKIFSRSGDEIIKTQALCFLGDLRTRQSRYRDAEALYRSSLQIAKREGDDAAEGLTIASLALMKYQEGSHGESKRLTKKSINYFNKLEIVSLLIKFNIVIGCLEEKDGNSNAAAEAFGKALSKARESTLIDNHVEILVEMASLWRRTGEPSIPGRVASFLDISEERAVEYMQDLLNPESNSDA